MLELWHWGNRPNIQPGIASGETLPIAPIPGSQSVSRESKGIDGIGTLPPDLERASDIVAISADNSNEGQNLALGLGLALHADGKVSRWGHFTGGGKDAKPGTLYPAPTEVRDIAAKESAGCADIAIGDSHFVGHTLIE